MLRLPVLSLVPLLVLAFLPAGAARAEEERPPWFTNVADAVGLGGVRAKDGTFTDLDGDGYLDLCLDKVGLWLNRKGERFEKHERSGLVFPTIRRVPLSQICCPIGSIPSNASAATVSLIHATSSAS